ncbi:MAG: autotransporter outer membrane beta-barrel domain-containing protein [Kofleriaceae bacterium]
MPTTPAIRLALSSLLTGALCWGASIADAKPRRVVVTEFDGERTLADSGRTAVVDMIEEDYDLVAPKRWIDARAAATRGAPGPDSWRKASRQLGVDAVIEGWIQNEGRHKMLTLVVSEARTGKQIDTISIRLGAKGLTDASQRTLARELDELLHWVEGGSEGNPNPLPPFENKRGEVGRTAKPATKRPATDDAAADETEDQARPSKNKRTKVEPAQADDEAEPDDEDDEVKPPKQKPDTEVATADDPETRDNALITEFFPEESKEHEIVTGPKVKRVPTATPRFRIGAGGHYKSRSLIIGAENPEEVTQFAGVGNKGLEVNAAVYPFPLNKQDGILSGVGFSFDLGRSAGSVVTFADPEGTVGDYVINHNGWNTGVHYRAPLGDMLAIDGEIGYGQTNYTIVDAPDTFEVPDTGYSYLSAGAHLDLAITERASVGMGGKYLYVLDTGDLSSVDWYGPGQASGFALDGNFHIPLPSNLYVKGELSYTRIKTSFDGVGVITEDEGVSDATDSTVGGSLNVGIRF